MARNVEVKIDPRKDLTVIVEPTDSFKGGKMTFDMPFEPVHSYVGQVVMFNGGPSVIVHNLAQSGGDFEITDWKPETQELRVKIRKGAFGV